MDLSDWDGLAVFGPSKLLSHGRSTKGDGSVDLDGQASNVGCRLFHGGCPTGSSIFMAWTTRQRIPEEEMEHSTSNLKPKCTCRKDLGLVSL